MGSFSLLSPWGLALLGLLVPLVGLYILKVERKKLRVPSTWLWAEAKRDRMARSPFQRLIAQVPLVVELAALALLALAFARPVSRSDTSTAEHVAIVVDVSASMSARAKLGDQASRLDEAKRLARQWVGSVAPGTEIMVISAGRDARVASPLDRDRGRVVAALDALAVEDVEGDLAAAVSLAADRIGRLRDARIVVVTDGALAHPGSLAEVSVPLEALTVGDEIDNLGIVRVDVRSTLDPVTKQEQTQALLMLASSGKAPREAYVTMREDNASDVLASRRVLVKPGEKLPVVLSFFPASGDHRKGLVFDVSPHDAMEVDDVAYGRVPAGDKLPVVLASPDASPWIERAIESDPSVEISKGTLEILTHTDETDPGALVVVRGACPADPPGGDLLVVGPPEGNCHGVTVGAEIEKPSITSWESADPRLRFLSLDGVGVAKTRRLLLDSPKRELVRGREGPLVVDASSPGRAVTIVGFDVGDSDWPLKASFVVFVRNVMEQARIHRASGLAFAARTGEPLLVNVPSDTVTAELTRPGSPSEPISARGGLVVVPDVLHTGLYRITMTRPKGATLVVPVNLASAAESDLARRLPPLSTSKLTVHAASERPVAYRDHAWILGLLALGMLLFDVTWVTRRARPKSLPRAQEHRS